MSHGMAGRARVRRPGSTTMTERHIFLAALDLADPAQRAAYLDRACGGDRLLRARIQALLRSAQDLGEYLEVPAVQQSDLLEALTDLSVSSPPVARDTDPGGLGRRGDSTPDAIPATALASAGALLGYLSPPQTAGNLGRLGHYEVHAVIGQGGMGVVLRAFDEKLRRVVAIKMLAPFLAASEVARKRFLREARAAAAVVHEHVVTIHAVEEGDGLPYLVMEHIAGKSLEQWLEDFGPMSLRDVLRIGAQTAEGLAAAHARGIVHRDVKPGNILLAGEGARVKLTDFGLARTADEARLTEAGVVAGTPHYMAPEQARGEPVDHRADLFSLGSVLYAACTGYPPFRAEAPMAVLVRVCEETPSPVRASRPELPAWLEVVISRLLAKDPASRYPSAAEVAAALRGGMDGVPAEVPVPSPADVPHRVDVANPAAATPPTVPRVAPASGPRGRGPAVVAVVTAALLAVAAIIVFAKPGRREASPSESAPSPPEVIHAALLNPLDALRPADIPVALQASAGGGYSGFAPPELVAVLGDARFEIPFGAGSMWMDVSPDGRKLAVPCEDFVQVFDATRGTHLMQLRCATGSGKQAVFSRDGRLLAACTALPSGSFVWDMETGRRLYTTARRPPPASRRLASVPTANCW
jgi:serine/threonine protein kinase